MSTFQRNYECVCSTSGKQYDCFVDHLDSAASEVIGDAGFVVEPHLPNVVDALDRALAGDRPVRDPVECAAHYDWDNVATQAENAYLRAVNSD